jgi:broad specificity phosphatase PhoE
VYSSDLSRAVFAGQLIADTHGLTPRIVPGLREANIGDWETKPLGEIALAHPEMVSELFKDPAGFRYPGGESFAELESRVGLAFREILEAHLEGEIAIVTHGGVARLLIGSILGLLPRNLLRLSQDFGCLNIIDLHGGQPLVSMTNCVPGAVAG